MASSSPSKTPCLLTPTLFSHDPLSDGLRWRCIGPPRGGRVVAVAGDYNDPMTFYFGACAGGVWKTTDGGTYWECISDGFFKSATIGALAVSQSDSNVIYAGTGETTIRIDVSYGDGVYKSVDAGKTWSHMGLEETRHIGEIRVHPTNPDSVYVAAFGHAFGANSERGVYRSVDGGENWELLLHQNEDTGAIDISLDPENPRILFAAMWQARRNFWNLSSGGPGSGLFRSTDGGDTWEEVSNNPGFPDGILGKIGISISPAQSGRIWALVEATDDAAGLYRSDDSGESWRQVSPNRDLLHRPWYYTHVFADSQNADTVYVTNFQMWKSTDGGENFSEVTTPHGDNHDLWIDPNNNQRMVQGNDGGANVSFNGGRSWSTIYNQLTAQFYRMDVDNRFPYRVYATQQDNTSIAVPSAAEWGVITMRDCILPGTGESGFIAVHPDDSNIVYVGAVGSSPGGSGALQRYDHRTRQSQLINVWPEENTGYAPRDLKYRFAWTFPIVISPHDSKVLYAGGNHLFRSRDEGQNWEEISPDLSRDDADKQGYSGGPLTGDSAGAETYATLSTFVENPGAKGELWAGTDDGLVHISHDDGKNWQNITPPELPEWAYVGTIELSLHDAKTAYICATRFKLDDYSPYLFKTTDSGKTWSSIVGNFEADEITRVIRADPERDGLLFVGTETGIFYSLNDGQIWQRIGGGFPVVPVYDLKLKHGDLIAATHGRSFWVLDDVSPLRQVVDVNANMLVAPRETHRLKLQWGVGVFDGDGINYSPAFGMSGATYNVKQSNGDVIRKHLDVGENPPRGALLYYWLNDSADGDVLLSIRDKSGAEVATFFSNESDAGRPKLTRDMGLNRFVWELNYPAAVNFDPELVTKKYEPLAKPKQSKGPLAPPGEYSVELIVGGKKYTHMLQLLKDPRVAADQAVFDAQFSLLQKLVSKQSDLRNGVNSLRRMRRQLVQLAERLGDNASMIGQIRDEILSKMESVEGRLVNVHKESPRDVLRHPAGLDESLGSMMWTISMADTSPTSQVLAVSDELLAKVDGQLSALDKLVTGPIAELNAKIAEAGIEAIKG